MANAQKQVVYIDPEDDITSVIDKVTSSSAHIVALVLPKRYATLKSSVNMKLLKKSADKAKKKTVLISEDEGLLPLAGSIGMFVAASLKSRPAIPEFEAPDDTAPVISEDDPELDADAEIGVLAGGKKKSKKKSKKTTAAGVAGATAVAQSTSASEKSTKIKSIKEGSKIKVPNFDSFKLRIALIVLGVIALAVGWYVAFFVMPKANVIIQAQTSRLDTVTSFSVDPSADEDNLEEAIVVGQVQEISKTVTERFDATGEKDVGKKATGVMTVQNCDSSDALSLPAGTIFTDNNTGFDYVSDAPVEVPGGSFNGGGCSAPGESNVDVTAAQSGDTRNLSPRGYSVAGQSGFITGFGGSMSGGTSEIKTVVSQEDIDQATKVLEAKKDTDVRAELVAAFPEGTIAITESFETSNNAPASSQKVGAEVSEASVSAQFTYTIVGISDESMDAILRQAQEELFDSEEQAILDSGVGNVAVSLEEKKDKTYIVEAQTTGFVGPEINTEQLATDIHGMGFSEAIDFISSKAGVGSVELELTPFWVFSVPGPDKTTITIEISDDQLQ